MSRAILPDPPEELKQLSRQLCVRIREEISATGYIPFSRYMERALYEPGLGYYSAGLFKFGAKGDFVTAPEIGPLFARCLAAQIAQAATVLGPYDILEIGAGSGKLAAELLAALPSAAQPQTYRILERSADLRAEQQRTVAARVPGWQQRVRWLEAPPEQAWRGVLLANEVLDALAVERFRLAQGTIEQVGVGVAGDAFTWAFRPAPERLERAVRALGLGVSEPYTSEILPELPAFLHAITDQLSHGLALFIDYGYPRAEYYRAERRDGTLMCHYRHRAHADPFFWPGLQDLTAFVDFTALAEAAESCALDVGGYTSQALFLLGCGLDRIMEAASTSDAARLKSAAEAKQLTLPGMMGERFQVMALTRGLELPLIGFGLRDLRYRL